MSFSDDFAELVAYAWDDVIVPGVSKLLSDILHQGVDQFIYHGEKTGRKNTLITGGSMSYKDYAASFYNRSKTSSSNKGLSDGKGFVTADIYLESRGDAEALLEYMNDMITEYGKVSVNAFYEEVSNIIAAYGEDNPTVIRPKWSDTQYGWRSLKGAKYVKQKGRYYSVMLPPAKKI